MSEIVNRKLRIEKCLNELDEIHEFIKKKAIETGENREQLEKSIERQLSALRLWQGEARLSNSFAIGIASFGGALVGSVIGVVSKFI